MKVEIPTIDGWKLSFETDDIEEISTPHNTRLVGERNGFELREFTGLSNVNIKLRRPARWEKVE